MPWQQHWALVAGELIRDEETGFWVPAYPEVFATVMRQSGKTLWVLAMELDRALLWEPYDGKPQAIAYSGQTGSDARKKFRKEHWPLIRNSPLSVTVDKPRFMAEDTGIDFVNGATLTLWSNSEEAGHGSTVDLVAMDEIWADADDRREQAAIPATATRHDRQKLITSTGGTDRSVLYLHKQAAGRAAVAEGRTEGMAYLEFSADPDASDFDPEDPELWWSCMPALGYTITERSVRTALEEMKKEDGDLSEFCRAWLNITKRTGGDRVIPDGVWSAVLDTKAAPSGSCFIAVDGQPDQSSTSIAVADTMGNVEVVIHADGVSWALDKLVEIAKRLKAPVVVDKTGPVGHLADQLKARRVKVVEFGPRTVAHACAEIYDRISDSRIRVRPNFCDHCKQVPITAAVEGVATQQLGDGWKWSRKSTDTDISPLMAATLAVGATAGIGGKPPMTPLVAITR